jgi:hypothetical protein
MLTASFLVNHFVSKGVTPIWDCGSENLAAIAIAEKIGFEKTLCYPVYNWIPPTTCEYLLSLMKNEPKTIIPAALNTLRTLF